MGGIGDIEGVAPMPDADDADALTVVGLVAERLHNVAVKLDRTAAALGKTAAHLHEVARMLERAGRELQDEG